MAAVVARLARPEVNLAAWGGIVFPVALIVEAPIIMLLAASTALSKDCDSYLKLRRFMMWAGAILTALHVLVAFSPLYNLVAETVIGAPPETVAPGRIGLMIMTPWTWAIAYRRFNQGVLIRFGHSRAVGTGTLVRLGTDVLVLAIGYAIGTVPGIVVGASAIAAGVVAEAVYAGLRVRPVLREQVASALAIDPPLTFRRFLEFYIPLSMTSLLYLLIQPLGSMTMSRMPRPLDSLAVWPVVNGLFFILRSTGMAYNETVVALLDEQRAVPQLRRFAALLTLATTALLLVIAATPLASFWFEGVSGLKPGLASLAHQSLWFGLALPGLTVLQNLYQGVLVHGRRTLNITGAMLVFLLVSGALLGAGVVGGEQVGLYVGVTAFTLGTLLQTTWQWIRSRPAVEALTTGAA